jgi:hypothetical protein
MPNHITTVIEINDTNFEAIQFMINKDKEEHCFDFERIIPKPKELAIEAGSFGQMGYEYLQGNDNALDMLNDENKKRAIELGKQYQSNMEKYNAFNWYDWCVQNWGTKWNSYELYTDDDNMISFQTAWSHPLPVIEALSKKFPEAIFDVKFADEDVSYNVGRYQMKNGVIIMDNSPVNGSKEAYELYFEIWGGEEFYNLVDGEYVFDEESWDL